MGLIKTSHSKKFIGDYTAPDLFPEESRYSGYSEKRAYVAARLDELASRRALFLTDMANQPRNLIALANDVIHGVKISDSADGQMVSEPLPHHLSTYSVTIKTLDGKPLKWKGGREPTRAYGGDSIKEKHSLHEDYFWESEDAQESLGVAMAWQCLRQQGKHCKHAPSAKSRALNWKVEELKPEGYDDVFNGGEEKPSDGARGMRRTKEAV